MLYVSRGRGGGLYSLQVVEHSWRYKLWSNQNIYQERELFHYWRNLTDKIIISRHSLTYGNPYINRHENCVPLCYCYVNYPFSYVRKPALQNKVGEGGGVYCVPGSEKTYNIILLRKFIPWILPIVASPSFFD